MIQMLCNEYIAHDSKIFILHMRNHKLKDIPVVCVSEVLFKNYHLKRVQVINTFNLRTV